jgi:hypothetical protein
MGITNCVGLEARYKSILKLRKEIKQFLRKVDEAEQPFSRIYDLMRDARRHRGVNTEIVYGPDVLQVRNRLLTTVLLLRCDYAILLEFLTSLRGTASEVYSWISRDLRINLNKSLHVFYVLVTDHLSLNLSTFICSPLDISKSYSQNDMAACFPPRTLEPLLYIQGVKNT